MGTIVNLMSRAPLLFATIFLCLLILNSATESNVMQFQTIHTGPHAEQQNSNVKFLSTTIGNSSNSTVSSCSNGFEMVNGVCTHSHENPSMIFYVFLLFIVYCTM